VKEQLSVASFLVQVSPQAGFSIFLKIQEHDAVAEVRVAGDDASGDRDLGIGQRQSDANAEPDGELIGNHDAAAGEAEIAGFQGQGDRCAVRLQADGKLYGVAWVRAAVGLSDGGRTAGHWGKIGSGAGEY